MGLGYHSQPAQAQLVAGRSSVPALDADQERRAALRPSPGNYPPPRVRKCHWAERKHIVLLTDLPNPTEQYRHNPTPHMCEVCVLGMFTPFCSGRILKCFTDASHTLHAVLLSGFGMSPKSVLVALHACDTLFTIIGYGVLHQMPAQKPQNFPCSAPAV